jgi:hypothetical protein
MGLLLGRGFNQPDFENYSLMYEALSSYGGFLVYRNVEPGFLSYLFIMNKVGLSYEVVSNFSIVIISSLLCLSAFYTPNRSYFLIVFVCSIFSSYYFSFLTLNVVRQGFAVAFTSFFIYRFLFQNKLSYYFLIIAFLFHSSVFFILIAVLVCKFMMRFKLRFMFFIVLASLVFGLVDLINYLPLPDFVSARFDKLKNYSSGYSALAKNLVFLLTTILALFIFKAKANYMNARVLYLCASYLSVNLLFIQYGELSDRLVMYSILLIPCVYSSFVNVFKQKQLVAIFIILLQVIYALMLPLVPSVQGVIF